MGNTFCKDNNIYVMPCETNLSNIEIYYHLENKIKNTSNIVDTPSTIPNTTFVCVEHPQLTKYQVDELTKLRDGIIKRLVEIRGWSHNPCEIEWRKDKPKYTDIDGSTGSLRDVIIEQAF